MLSHERDLPHATKTYTCDYVGDVTEKLTRSTRSEHAHKGRRCGSIRRDCNERWGAGVETQKNVRGEIGGWGRVPLNEPYAPSLSTIYDGA